MIDNKPVIDVACGGRMFYFDKNDPLEFAQRYIYGRKYRTENWAEYCVKRGFKHYLENQKTEVI